MPNADPAASIRAAQAKAARDAALHDQPRLARMAELLDQIDPLALELAKIVPEVITPYLPAQVRGLTDGHRSLKESIASAQRAVDAALVEGA